MNTRREFLKTGGALVIGFSLGDTLSAQERGGATAPAARGTVAGPPDARQIDTWLAIHADNTATVYIGFAELGQGAFDGAVADCGGRTRPRHESVEFRADSTPMSLPIKAARTRALRSTGEDLRFARQRRKRGWPCCSWRRKI